MPYLNSVTIANASIRGKFLRTKNPSKTIKKNKLAVGLSGTKI
jgi:hypothetical protein